MPTVLTHAVLAGAAVTACGARRRLLAAAVAVSALPDADVIGFSFGVRYGDFLGHRGFFHSPVFALLSAAGCMLLLLHHIRPFSREWWRCWSFLALLGASHGVFDALTDGGLGIALLAPVENSR